MKEKIKLTDAEYELISAIRNYRASYPNGGPNCYGTVKNALINW